jgi:UDP-N-acetylmuramoyl-tripeptide--D-alanyl-D-alanine ligase
VKLSLDRVAALIAADPVDRREDGATLVGGYSIDSRTIASGEIFFAVRGERLDGHDYVAQALEKGAIAAVVERGELRRFPDRSRLLAVTETLEALHALAAAVRQLWGKPLIAITGSAGKTTTKEILARLLATRYRLLKSEGNFNNHFGLPLQLLRLEPEHDLAVLELGMSHLGEIAALAALARPNVGVVTNVAPVHLGFFKSVAEIAQAKKELVDALPADGIAVLNADDEYVSQFGRDFTGRVITFGLNNSADVRADAVVERGTAGSEFEIVADGERLRASLPLIGAHNVLNAMAAVAVARCFGIQLSVATGELANLAAVEKRGEVFEIGGATVVNDCYNSNPRALDSMVAALAAIAPGPGGRRIVVAGEMLELGQAGEDLHRRCGQYMAQRGVDLVLGVRGLARCLVEGARAGQDPNAVPGMTDGPQTSVPRAATSAGTRAEFVETPEQAGEWLLSHVRPGDVVLLKASRGVHLERALELWRARLGQRSPG